jgi:DNA-binding response OmpR family regulator
MSKPRVLFVDDEPGIRTTLGAILQMHGFDVTTRGSVPEALAAIQTETFDVLLTDLNIGQPADGFTLVSAMRRTQPQAVNVIITGYPAFETALHAIRAQVDDYFVKPADPVELIQRIQDRLARNDRRIPPPLKKLSFILKEHADQVLEDFLGEIYDANAFPLRPLSREQVLNHFPEVLQEVIAGLQTDEEIFPGDVDAAAQHGRERCLQDFSIPMLVHEFSLFRRVIFKTIEAHLLSVDVSSLVPDMIRVGQSLDARLKRAIEAYLQRSEELRKTA